MARLQQRTWLSHFLSQQFAFGQALQAHVVEIISMIPVLLHGEAHVSVKGYASSKLDRRASTPLCEDGAPLLSLWSGYGMLSMSCSDPPESTLASDLRSRGPSRCVEAPSRTGHVAI